MFQREAHAGNPVSLSVLVSACVCALVMRAPPQLHLPVTAAAQQASRPITHCSERTQMMCAQSRRFPRTCTAIYTPLYPPHPHHHPPMLELNQKPL